MASVRDTVHRFLVEYPMLGRNKSDCFAYMFFMNGNGMHWINGQLVDLSGDPSKPIVPAFLDENELEIPMDIASSMSPEQLAKFKDKMLRSSRLDIRRQNTQVRFAMENIDLLLDEDVFFSQNYFKYSGANYCNLMKVPDDADPDWLEAVKDCVRAVKEYLLKIEDNKEPSILELQTDIQELYVRLGMDKTDARRRAAIAEILKKLRA